MPELPEVETTRRGIAPYAVGRRIVAAVVRDPRLRHGVPAMLDRSVAGERVTAVDRRGKYLIIHLEAGGGLILHLGMAGSLRWVDPGRDAGPHDHVDFAFEGGRLLRLTDPRRFGSVLFRAADPLHHPLLAGLGPEPLHPAFCGDLLHHRARGRRRNIKAFLLDGRNVAGLGNIYVNEALFMAGIHPCRAAGRIALPRYRRLADAIREVLTAAVSCGGTTLRDFLDGAGRPGYFQLDLAVYGRGDTPCPRCAGTLSRSVVAQRATYYCRRCQR